ncbi:alpha/beta hydrolase fold domain-containing protein [Trematosphaeria pertusa]|uniref:Alpha/beta hydrolase fold domain-containing protein n=1 Tax=Trematosphaeria pertusa TaxID=390896 RepID=A0A6A6IA11_9PLEO|nr:alpha/beta hydrolase fold domain-containing protein [Trematosphaeria pertusa]KAF2246363.1 alpha/beta hydrolase fold domain-containing protein [Trematosphaeria pertusa]
MRESESLTLSDGRVLSYAVYGSPMPQTTVFYFHAFPSSRLEGKLWHSAAARLNVRLIAPDRPGMGNSTFQPNRTLLDWPNDVLALADHLKIHKFYVTGLSGGGPYTLACVKHIPKERLAGAAVVSGLYPVSFGTAGMLFFARMLLWVGPWMPGLVGTMLDMAMGKAARNEDPKVFEDLLMKEIESRPEVDRNAMKDEKNREAFIEGTREGLRQGGQGSAWEARLNGSPWGFELSDLDIGEEGVPLALWHGSDDINCPVAMVLKAQELMPNVNLHLKDGEGHVSYAFRHQEEILQELIGIRDF